MPILSHLIDLLPYFLRQFFYIFITIAFFQENSVKNQLDIYGKIMYTGV